MTFSFRKAGQAYSVEHRAHTGGFYGYSYTQVGFVQRIGNAWAARRTVDGEIVAIAATRAAVAAELLDISKEV